MRKIIRIISIILCITIIFCNICAFGETDNDNITDETYSEISMIGEYDSDEFGFVILYPNNFYKRYTLPVIVWSGGSTNTPDAYDSIYNLLVSNGFIIITSTDNYLTDGTIPSKAIDYILEQNNDVNSPIYQRVDTDSIAVAGHSLGGRNSINAAVQDERIKAVASIFGSNTASERVNIDIPCLFFGGENDDTINSDLWVKPMYNACEGPAVYALVKDATHQDIYSQPELYTTYIANWFYTWLYDDQELKEIFVKDGMMENDEAFIDFQYKNFESDYIYVADNDIASKVLYNKNLTILISSVIISIGVIISTIIIIIFKTKKRNNNKKE